MFKFISDIKEKREKKKQQIQAYNDKIDELNLEIDKIKNKNQFLENQLKITKAMIPVGIPILILVVIVLTIIICILIVNGSKIKNKLDMKIKENYELTKEIDNLNSDLKKEEERFDKESKENIQNKRENIIQNVINENVDESKNDKIENKVNDNKVIDSKEDKVENIIKEIPKVEPKKESNVSKSQATNPNMPSDVSQKPKTNPNTNVSKNVPQSETYVLNKNSKKIHRPNCSSVNRMKASNRETYVGPKSDLLARGYTTCSNCKP